MTPETGYNNRATYFAQCTAGFTGHKADFTKYCYDRDPQAFRASAERVRTARS